MVFDNVTCFYERVYECSIVAGGGVVVIVLGILVLCILVCLCHHWQKKRRRSRDITESSTGKSARNDYKIESLHTDVTDDYAVGSGLTDPLNSNSMKDFHNISLRVPHSIHEETELQEGSSGIPMIPMDLSAGKGSQSTNNSSRIKGHSYDDVLPSESSNSVDATSSTGKTEPYSVAMTHTLVLSNMDTRGQGRKGHTYHLLDGSNPNEKATVVAVGSTANSTSLSKENSLRRNVGLSNLNHDMEGNRQSRRTTLSSIPSKQGLFDDPNYANTSITVPGSARAHGMNGIDGKRKENLTDATAPTRSRSLVQNSDERSLKASSKPKLKPAIVTESAERQPQNKPAKSLTLPHASAMFDDPMYDVGLNLTNS